MPVCQKCQADCDDLQHFCLECGSYLKKDRQPFFLKPKYAAETETAPELQLSNLPSTPETAAYFYIKSIVRMTIVIAVFSFVAGAFFVWLKDSGPRPHPGKVTESTVQESSLPQNIQNNQMEVKQSEIQSQVEVVLKNIKQAQLHKNLGLFMSTLSTSYPELDKKRQQVIKVWKKFNFKDLEFSVVKFENDSDKAVAVIKWKITSENINTGNVRTEEFQYQVLLSKELDQWKINRIEQIPL